MQVQIAKQQQSECSSDFEPHDFGKAVRGSGKIVLHLRMLQEIKSFGFPEILFVVVSKQILLIKWVRLREGQRKVDGGINWDVLVLCSSSEVGLSQRSRSKVWDIHFF
ncbi:hypothetical protein SDJN03_13373, partial [Cucurbita argyrosperma subsp. sororia]